MIPAGTWSASLDLATASTTNLIVTFSYTQSDGTLALPICSVTQTVSTGDNQPFDCSASAVSLAANQRIRLTVDYALGSNLTIQYNGGAPSSGSLLTRPNPQFSYISGPALASGGLGLFCSSPRGRQ